MTRPGYSDRATLRSWADRRESEGEFPRLVRRLILETTPGLVELGIPAGDGVSAGGWDGVVVSTEGSAWVPKGRSLWELSTKRSVGVKADSDYDKRTTDPGVAQPSEHEYVAGSLRPWLKRADWAKEKREEGFWKDVRAYGLDDIDAWLEHAPATWAWFSEQNGLTPYGLRTASNWWASWATRTEPRLPADIVLAGRDESVKRVVDRLERGGFVTTIGGRSRDDACAFLAGCAIARARAGDGDMIARMVFVDDIIAWRRLLDGDQPLVLIPLEPQFAEEVPPGSPHQVFVPVDRAELADTSLSPLDASRVRDTLEAAGVDHQEADDYGRLARRSLTAFRRRLGASAALGDPGWSRHPVSRAARACLLAGAWVDGREGDQAALAELAGVEYDDFVEQALGLSDAADPLVAHLDGAWHLTDPLDAWSQLRGAVTSQDLERITAVMSTVLGEVDPALDLPQEERWWRAAFDGKQRSSSSQLRRGLANTLALLGQFGEEIQASSRVTGADLASGVARKLLSDANSDLSGQRWASIADLLPLIAEAAPDAFLEGVQEGLSGETPLLTTIFADDGDPLFGSGSPHTGLLWALETVAWSSAHLGLVVELLARLTEIDPGGRLSNRPANSLSSIFCPWHPENTASDESRLRIIDAIRRRHPEVAWTLMLDLLPESHATHSPTHAPQYRDWKPSEISVTYAAYWAFTASLVERCTEDAGASVYRWLELIEKIDQLPPPDRAGVLSALRFTTIDEDVLDDGERTQIWDKLRSLVNSHRSFSHADWALPEDELASITELVDELRPTGARVRVRWLFDGYPPDLEDVKWSDDRERYDEALRTRRLDAIESVLSEEGLPGVKQFADSLDQPWSVGVALADASPTFDDQLITPLGSTDVRDRLLPWAYFARRFANEGWDWLEGFVESSEHDPAQRARLLLASSDFPTAWEWADTFGEETAAAFWGEFRQNGLGQDFEHVQLAARRLMNVGRHAVALGLINIYSRRSQEGKDERALLAAEGLEALLSSQPNRSELAALGSHGLRSLFALLESQREAVGMERVAKLEWAYLPALGFEPTIPSLAESLAESPDLFVEVISQVYRAHGAGQGVEEDQDGETEDGEPTDSALAQNAFRLLSNWSHPPGMGDDSVDEAALNAWIGQVIAKLKRVRRVDVGMRHIGRILTAYPPGEDGVRPPKAVRELIETLASPKVEEGFVTQTLNSRGVTSRGPEDGGAQEEVLVAKFREDAEALADEYPRTAGVLRQIAQSYEREARRNEASAERFRRGL